MIKYHSQIGLKVFHQNKIRRNVIPYIQKVEKFAKTAFQSQIILMFASKTCFMKTLQGRLTVLPMVAVTRLLFNQVSSNLGLKHDNSQNYDDHCC